MLSNDFSKSELNKIEDFINQALEFNKTHNIFSRKSFNEVFQKDILDCAPLAKKIALNKSIVDLGSGGGFPGILLSIQKPKNKITLIESSTKKCYFLKKIIHNLSLTNTTIVNKTITADNNIGKFDIITARAFSDIKKVLKLTRNNTKPFTKYLLLKGKAEKIAEELKDVDKNKHICEIINLSAEKYERNLVVIKKNE
tara:strand:- start:172 stop:765 length:594 start_codon:yes stop_codon:yes gene_type:complete